MKLFALVFVAPCAAQFGGIFDQFFGGQQQQQQQHQRAEEHKVNNIVENTYVDFECDKYLCEDTLACVATPQDCPCLFPDSQLKCEFPGNKGYVCISKPSNEENPGCEYVLEAVAGRI